MRFLPYRLIKSGTLKQLRVVIDQKESEIKSATDFIKAIEQGNLDSVISLVDSSENAQTGELSSSLLSMRDHLKDVAEKERERKWTTEGLAKFVEILRAGNHDMHALSEIIISSLVKYMQANQGGLFIVNDENEQEPYLELTACYAYGRKKFLEKKIALGEGLVGQAYLEKDTLYLTDIPNNYVRITSGLGEALPKNILIVPLKLNEKVFGVVEIASFQLIKKYQIEFVEKLGESIASTISSVQINAKTRKLLEESQTQAEHMRSQEEEMRQNLEELSATQEEMQRVLKELNTKEAFMNDLLNASTDSILTLDADYKLISCNRVLRDTYRGLGMTIEKGFDVMNFFSPEQQPVYRSYYDRAFSGENFEVTENYSFGGKEQVFSIVFSPLRNESGSVTAVAVFGKDITEIALAKKKTEALLAESQLQSEELKAQEEEMRQNLEELSATQEEMQRVMADVQEKEAYVNEIINSTQDAIVTIDREYKIVTCNNVMRSQYNLDLPKGYDALLMFPEEQRAQAKQRYARALAGESFETQEQYTAGGMEIYFTMNYTPLRNNTGEVIGLATFARNVTETVLNQKKIEQLLFETQQQSEEMKAQEEELRQNMEELSATQEEMQRLMQEMQEKEAYLSEIINAAQDAILTVDREYKIITCNKVLERNFNLVVEKGTDVIMLSPPENRVNAKAYYDRALAGESFEVTEYYASGDSGVYCVQAYSPLRNGAGEIIGAMLISKNVTQLVSTQQEMQRVVAEVQSKEAILNNLLNATTDSIVAIDRNYRIVSCNDVLKNVYRERNIPIDIGFDMMQLAPAAQKDFYKSCYERAFAGESFEIPVHYTDDGFNMYLQFIYSPLKNTSGEIIGAVIWTRDTTVSTTAQQQMAKLAADVQQQAQELKAQEKEMQQYMQDLLSAQEELTRKTSEIEAVRQSEKKNLDAVKRKATERETELLSKIARLETQLKNRK